MVDINMNTLNDALIGIDKKETAMAFYMRDNLMNTNTNNQIIDSLKKLRYYNIDLMTEERNYILDHLAQTINIELNNNWDSDIKSKTINDMILQIKQSQNYKLFLIMLNSRIGRAMVLSKFINYNDTFNFYDALTLNELQFLGY